MVQNGFFAPFFVFGLIGSDAGGPLGYLGGIEKLADFIPGEEVEEHAVGGAGDEVANVADALERRHHKAEGFSRLYTGLGDGIAFFLAFTISQHRSAAAEADGSIALGRDCHILEFGLEAFKEWILGHWYFSARG